MSKPTSSKNKAFVVNESKYSFLPHMVATVMPPEEREQYDEATLHAAFYRSNLRYAYAFNWLENFIDSVYALPEQKHTPRPSDNMIASSLIWMLIKRLDDIEEKIRTENIPTLRVEATRCLVNQVLFNTAPTHDWPETEYTHERAALVLLASKLRMFLTHDLAPAEAQSKMQEFGTYWHPLLYAMDNEFTARSIQEYLDHKHTTAVLSGMLSFYGITGGPDSDYAKERYGKNIPELRHVMRDLGAIGNYFDSFQDFQEDKAELMKDFTPKRGDQTRALARMMRELGSFSTEHFIKHPGSYARFLARCSGGIAKESALDVLQKAGNHLGKAGEPLSAFIATQRDNSYAFSDPLIARCYETAHKTNSAAKAV